MVPSSPSADAVKTSSRSAIGVASLKVSVDPVDLAELVAAHALELVRVDREVLAQRAHHLVE